MATKLKAQASIAADPSPSPNANAKVQPQRKSNAQRQADYRRRHLKEMDGQLARLSLLVDFHTKLALERLASCYGVTQRVMLERLLLQANRVAQQQTVGHSPNGPDDYSDKCISLQWPGVTP